MQFVSGEEMGRALSFPALVAALEASHAGPRMEIQDHLMGTEQALYFVRSAADHGRAFGSKLVTSFPGNLEATAEGGTACRRCTRSTCCSTAAMGVRSRCSTAPRSPLGRRQPDLALGAKLLAPAEPRRSWWSGPGRWRRGWCAPS